LLNQIQAVRSLVQERTEVHVDLHQRHGSYSHVVVIGEFHGRDYVRCFSVMTESLEGLIERLRGEEKYAKLGRIDGFDHMGEIRAAYLNPGDRL